MRSLSDFEKKVTVKICEKHQFFSDIFEDDFLQGLIIEITNDSDKDINQIKIIIKKDDNNTDDFIQKKMFEATDKLAQTINLLNYLKNQAYIYSFKPAHGFSVQGYIGLKKFVQDYKEDPNKWVSIPFPDIKTYNFIFEFVDINFASTEALKEYVSKGFRTSEQIRHSQNLYIAWTAIIVSIALGIVGIYCN